MSVISYLSENQLQKCNMDRGKGFNEGETDI